MKLIDALRGAILDTRRLASHGFWLEGSSDADGSKRLAKQLQPALFRAVVFNLDNDVVEAACRLALDHPDVLAELSRRIRLPYEVCFFQWSNWHRLEVCRGVRQPSAPEFVGALALRDPGDTAQLSWTTTGLDSDGIIGVSPFATAFSPDLDWGGHSGLAHVVLREEMKGPNLSGLWAITPESVNEEGYDHWLLHPWLYGGSPWSSEDYDAAPMQWDAVRSLCRRTLIRINRFETYNITRALDSDEVITYRTLPWQGDNLVRTKRSVAQRHQMLIAYGEELGDAKLIVAALALINAGNRIVDFHDDYVKGSTLVKGKIVKYMSSQTIKLKLPLKRVQRMMRAQAFHSRKRHHEVMGHWCSTHLVGDPTCSHTYEDIDPNHKLCNKCKHRVWFRKEHFRGDAGVGFVRQSYQVETR